MEGHEKEGGGGQIMVAIILDRNHDYCASISSVSVCQDTKGDLGYIDINLAIPVIDEKTPKVLEQAKLILILQLCVWKFC